MLLKCDNTNNGKLPKFVGLQIKEKGVSSNPVNQSSVEIETPVGALAIKNNMLGSSGVSFKSLSNLSQYETDKVQNEIANIFEVKKYDNPDSYTQMIEDVSITAFSENLLKIFEKNNIYKKEDLLKSIEKSKDISEEDIVRHSSKYDHTTLKSQTYFGEVLRKEFLNGLNSDLQKYPDNKIFSNEELEKLVNNLENQVIEKHSEYTDQNAYSDKLEHLPEEEVQPEKITLNQKELDTLKRNLYHHKVDPDDNDFEKIANMWIAEYVGGAGVSIDSKLITACLQTQKRYNSQNRKYFAKYKEPLYRWLMVQNPVDFIKNFPKEGEIYSYPKLQSCSKNKDYAENQYRDDSPDMNVKLIFHPIAETSQAYDIGERKYGDYEAIYPPNIKFRVVGKEIVSGHYDSKNYGTAGDTFYRYVIHLQEVHPENSHKTESEQELKNGPCVITQDAKASVEEYKLKTAEKISKLLKFYPETKEFQLSSTYYIFPNSQVGTSWGAFATNKDKTELYYAKFGGQQSRQEAFTSELYKLCGVNVPDMTVETDESGRDVLLSKFIPDVVACSKTDDEIKSGFAADAWLANWDSVVDCNVVKSGNKTYRMDLGGSLDFRARGGRKYYRPDKVYELSTFLNPDINWEAATFFGSMSREDLIKSLKKVAAVKDEDIIALSKKYDIDLGLTDAIISRKEYLKKILNKAEYTSSSNMKISDYVEELTRY